MKKILSVDPGTTGTALAYLNNNGGFEIEKLVYIEPIEDRIEANHFDNVTRMQAGLENYFRSNPLPPEYGVAIESQVSFGQAGIKAQLMLGYISATVGAYCDPKRAVYITPPMWTRGQPKPNRIEWILNKINPDLSAFKRKRMREDLCDAIGLGYYVLTGKNFKEILDGC